MPSGCPECRHILPGGRNCHASALQGKAFCAAHLRRRTLIEANRARRHSVALPPLEDRAALQMSLDQVLAALAAHKISRREAGTYLFALQIGELNLTRMERLSAAPEPPPTEGESVPAQGGAPQPDPPVTDGVPEPQPIPPEPGPAPDLIPPNGKPVEPEPDPLLEPDPSLEEDQQNRPEFLLDDPSTDTTCEYDPEPPFPLSPKQLREKRKLLEDQIRQDREAQAFYRAMPQDDPNQNPPLVIAWLQKNIDRIEAELQALNQQAAPDSP